MNRPRRSLIVTSITMAVVLGACGWGMVRYNLVPFVCIAPPDQRDMINRLEDDPLFSVAPDDGVLADEGSTNYECDNGHGGSPSGGPEFATVARYYRTPSQYGSDQLHGLFDQRAAAAGWREFAEEGTDYTKFGLCRDFGDRVANAWITANRKGVSIILDARVDGSACVPWRNFAPRKTSTAASTGGHSDGPSFL